jgi:hypothetical protein
MSTVDDRQTVLAAKFEAILPHLDERQRRLLLGAELRGFSPGVHEFGVFDHHGTWKYLSRLAFCSRATATSTANLAAQTGRCVSFAHRIILSRAGLVTFVASTTTARPS